jgi:hypothetical protein
MKFNKSVLFAALIVTTFVAPWSAYSSVSSCATGEASSATIVQDDLAQAVDMLGEIIRLVQAGTAEPALERARATGRFVVGFSDTATTTAVLEAASSLFRARRWNDVARAFLEGAIKHLAPIGRQASVWDTEHVGLFARTAREIETRSGPRFVSAMKRLERDINESGICAERAFFLRLRVARELEVHNELDLAQARMDGLARDARTLRGSYYRGESLSWLALYHLTYLAIDLHAFETASVHLRDVTAQANEMAASGRHGTTNPAEFLETLPAYFRQERVRYYCPRVPGREGLPCPYER